VTAGPTETRKIVTVLFSDLAGSTALGEKLDPEALRRLMSRYFEETRIVLERHGGSVEKFIGDAVVAVFGVPRLHEDDALRAVRAAGELREMLADLNAEFDRTWDVTLEVRTGVNTGEVIAGDPGGGQSFVAGDTVNTAARLEQIAQAGEILIGESTYRLVRNAVVAEQVAPLAIKDKAEPVAAWRLLEVLPDVSGWRRDLDSPLVGRDSELAALSEVFEEAAGAAGCEVVTIVGAAGIGKTRLTNEFLAAVEGRATTIKGRCLPYGEGITFWPIVEVLRDAAGIGVLDAPEEARAKLSALAAPTGESTLVADRLAALLGLAPTSPGIPETFWAVRKLFEHLAAERPLVVVFEDVHWGESTFLDLVEYLAASTRASSVVILCLARPELFQARADWMAGQEKARVIRLDPLTEDESGVLIRNLLGGAELGGDARDRIAEVAEGNPLFLEETLRMLVDDGSLRRTDGTWTMAEDVTSTPIPETVQAVVTARLDRLEPEERSVIERASVVGRVFWWGAVSELSPDELRPHVGHYLHSLMRKELIRPDRSDIGREDAFRFAHIVIRDAAYQEIPKAVRADLHERLAAWIDERTRDRAGEYEEILGYHLEQAYRSLVELGPVDERVETLGRRAARPLASAGRRAFARGDMPAAVKLLTRATSVVPEEDPERLRLLPQLAFALMETLKGPDDFPRLQAVVAETHEAAIAVGDPGLEAHAAILGMWIRLWTNPVGWVLEAQKEAMRAISAFEALGDEAGLAKAWPLLGLVHMMSAQFGRAEEAWEEAAAHATRAGDQRAELENLSWVPLTVWAGPAAADEGLGRIRQIVERAGDDKKVVATVLGAQAAFEAGRGRFDEARALIAQAKAVLGEVALTFWMAGPVAQLAGWVELLAGDPAGAEEELRWGYEKLGEIGDVAWLSTTAAMLAEAVWAQGRFDEAEQLTTVSEQSAGPEDVYSQVMWRSVRAKVLARRGRAEEGEELAREAVELAGSTDFFHLRWHALMCLAEVLRLAGKDAGPVVDEAIRHADQKGNVVAAQKARDLVPISG
jgi:class 3 adenylate cyclase/tetratricopeptide (TPR) repeat protein